MSGSNNERLGAFLFPSASSQQRAASESASSRSKIALKPGRSLMDWIRLTHSGKDLTGVEGKRLDVTTEELAKHSRLDDAWICLKGKVYNITPYMEFHPGGFEELMRGAGKEATELFNEVHKWVNFESMLEKCLVGRLSAPAKARATLGEDLVGVLKAKIKAENKRRVSAIPSDIFAPVTGATETPKYDWFQTEKSASIVVYTKCKSVTQHDVIIDVIERDLRVSFRLQEMIYILHLELGGNVTPAVNVKIGRNSGCAELLVRKTEPFEMWPDLGKPLNGHNTFLASTMAESHFRNCTLMSKCQVTHDTYLFELELPEGTKMKVPAGHHVVAQLKVESMEVSRSYTPVTSALSLSKSTTVNDEENQRLHLMIKIYQDGAFTSVLQQLTVGDSLSIGDPSGTFESSKLNECQKLVLIAAGTGFTPMVKVIQQFLTNTQDRKIWLMLFNKTEQDIPWRDQIEKLAKESQRLEVRLVLSEPSEDWSGGRGRVRAHLLATFLPKVSSSPTSDVVSLNISEEQDLDNGDDHDGFKSPEMEMSDPGEIMVCVCGPPQFTQVTLRLLERLGYNSNNVHAFTG